MNKDDIFKVIIRHISDIMPNLKDHVFQPNDQLKELGVNSIDRADVITMSMESLSLKVPLVEVAGAKNIGELADVLYEKLQVS